MIRNPMLMRLNFSFLRPVALIVFVVLHFGAATGARGQDDPLVGPYLVANVETGEVYRQHDATRPWYPASTTKLMTAYVTFRAIRNGELTLDSVVTMSKHAAAEPASKMGFKPGTELTVRSALGMVLVHSANDVAMALAETVGGSQEGFAARMNAEAKRLGMTRSHFINPHGLPDEDHVSSARDMAMLTRALIVDFPQHREFFTIPAIEFGGKVMKNHNDVLTRYPGATGMKTGYICSSGFNIVVTARRDGTEIVAVVFGAYRSSERGEFAARLLEEGFEAAATPRENRSTLADISSGAHFEEPYDLRPVMCTGAKRPTLASDEPSALGPQFFLGPPMKVGVLYVPGRTAPLPRARPVLASDFPQAEASAFAPEERTPDPSAAVIGPPLPRTKPAAPGAS